MTNKNILSFKKMNIKFLFLFCSLLCCTFSNLRAEAFNIGFNQGWINNHYNKQWSDKYFDIVEVRRVLDLTKKAGSKTIRMWVFEGLNSTALEWKDGKVSGLSPEFLKNFEQFLNEAKERDLQIYVTLFDFGILRNNKDKNQTDRWWNLMNNQYAGLDAFQNDALAPLLKLLYDTNYRSTIFGIDLANEIDASIIHNQFIDGWFGANAFICKLKNYIHNYAPANSSFIPVTASMGWPYIPFKSRGAENIILDPNPYPSCVDFWDIHYYDNDGDIGNCERIKALVSKYGKKIYLGEFGQFSKSFNDSTQMTSTTNFINNAKQCGFSGAFAWRLADGLTKDSYHSYETSIKGNMRKAYYYIKARNEPFILKTSLKKSKTARKIASFIKKKQKIK